MHVKIDRRVKYTEPRKDFLLKIPLSVFERLKEKASKNGLSVTETINAHLLSSIDSDFAVEMARSLKELNEEIRKWKSVAKKQQDMLDHIQSRLKNDVLSLYTEIKADPELESFVKKFKNDYLKVFRTKKTGIERDQTRKAWTNIIYRKFEERMIEKGKMIKSEKLAKAMIRMVLKELEG
ncbi:hypothetical protein DRH29_04850 [candidate division Kazan bacterium]|uniref:Uncharacterized protein n=1 Tax=candidate division Kazan bacterium TaxID=2202143 RepID=A0A420ZBC1_UNCK3|nr:MAG: hypothetical protein DRH29_04850 [candidate division Kazan bacterium]